MTGRNCLYSVPLKVKETSKFLNDSLASAVVTSFSLPYLIIFWGSGKLNLKDSPEIWEYLFSFLSFSSNFSCQTKSNKGRRWVAKQKLTITEPEVSCPQTLGAFIVKDDRVL